MAENINTNNNRDNTTTATATNNRDRDRDRARRELFEILDNLYQTNRISWEDYIYVNYFLTILTDDNDSDE